jgi:hypothetical protein
VTRAAVHQGPCSGLFTSIANERTLDTVAQIMGLLRSCTADVISGLCMQWTTVVHVLSAYPHNSSSHLPPQHHQPHFSCHPPHDQCLSPTPHQHLTTLTPTAAAPLHAPSQAVNAYHPTNSSSRPSTFATDPLLTSHPAPCCPTFKLPPPRIASRPNPHPRPHPTPHTGPPHTKKTDTCCKLRWLEVLHQLHPMPCAAPALSLALESGLAVRQASFLPEHTAPAPQSAFSTS